MLAATAGFLAAAEPSAKPTRAVVVPTKASDPDSGNIKVEFSGGHSETWTIQGSCKLPQISHQGDVGWVHMTRTGDALQVRLSNGTNKEFRAHHGDGPFIEEWGFADNGAAVVIKSRGRHGVAYFVRYALASGRELGHLDKYVPYQEQPAWVQPYSDDKPDGG